MKIDKIKSVVSIRDVLEKFGVFLDRKNKGLCPFHSDTKPSLSVKGERFTCFACGAKGDVIDFVRLFNKCQTSEAISVIDNMFGLGISKPLSKEEKIKFAKLQKQREKERKKKENLEKFRKQVFDDVLKKLSLASFNELQLRYYTEGDLADLWWYWKKRVDYLEWLAEVINLREGEIPELDVEWNFTIGYNAVDVLRKIYKKEIVI